MIAGIAGCDRSGPPATQPAPVPTTAPATQQVAAAANPSAAPVRVRTFVDVVRAIDPGFPTTQPVDERLAYSESAAIVLTDPVYLCPRGELWITREDASPMAAVLRRAKDEQTHVVPERVEFVHWPVDEATGEVRPHVVVSAEDGAVLVLPNGRRVALTKRDYSFGRAFTWNNRIVVPTGGGVSVISVNAKEGTVAEAYTEFGKPDEQAAKDSGGREPVVLPDTRGLLAFVPGVGVQRYLDEKWVRLEPEKGWPEDVLHLVPLLDGSVLQILSASPNRTELRVTLLDEPQVDKEHVGQLVANLSADEEKVRSEAFAELSRYGPALWPVLDQLLGDQPPEAQIRLQQLLQNKTVPTLGGMTVVRNDLRLLKRYPNGGALFFSEAGVTLPTSDPDRPERYSPAYVSVLPGRTPAPLPARLTFEADPERVKLFPHQNTWIVSDDVQGPRMLAGNNTFIRLVPKAYRAKFTEFVGQDATGRMLFRSEISDLKSQTLVVDPFLPDPAPRLPVWVFDVPPNGTVGWDAAGYPVVKSGGAYAIEADRFRGVKKDESVSSDAQAATPTPGTVETEAGTCTADNTSLKLTKPDGSVVTWALPASATGSIEPHLVETPEKLLFLYNAPGRLLRIRPTPGEKEPFKLEATFTDRIPNLDKPLRIWVDPAGRIVIAAEKSVSLLFPSGRIPRGTAMLMPAEQLDAAEE